MSKCATSFPKLIPFEEVPIWAILKSSRLIEKCLSKYTVVRKSWVKDTVEDRYICYVIVRWFNGSTWSEDSIKVPLSKN